MSRKEPQQIAQPHRMPSPDQPGLHALLRCVILGTSSGVPTLRRNVSGVALCPVASGRGRPGWILVDAGEGTQHRLQQVSALPGVPRLSLHDLAVVAITHVHGDHCYGLPGLLASAGMTGRRSPLTLVGPANLHAWLQATFSLTDSHLPYPLIQVEWPSSAAATAAQQPLWSAEGLTLTAYPLSHRVPCMGYRLQADRSHQVLKVAELEDLGLPKGPLWGQLLKGQDVSWQGQTLRSEDWVQTVVEKAAVVVGGDNDRPECLTTAAEGAQLVIHEATYTQAALEAAGPGYQHSSAQAVARWAQRARVPHLVLTHMSPRHHAPQGQAQLLAEARAEFSGPLWLARDGDVFDVMPLCREPGVVQAGHEEARGDLEQPPN